MHTIVTGLRSLESPDWGGWGGRYVRVRENTWLDPVPVEGYEYPEGRWYGSSAWGRDSLREGTTTTAEQRREYFKPMWRWADVLQNDFAARADWCVKPFDEANHPPLVQVNGELNRRAKAGETVRLAGAVSDPDGDEFSVRWWQYAEADSADATVAITASDSLDNASFVAPDEPGKQVHIILEVTDNGTPPLTRYQRVIIDVE